MSVAKKSKPCTFQSATLAATRGTEYRSCHFRVHFNVLWSRDDFYLWFQHAVLAAMRGTDGGLCYLSFIRVQRYLLVYLRGANGWSCHCRVHFNVRTSGSVWCRRRVVSLSCIFQRAVLADLCSTDGFRITFVYISTCHSSGSVWCMRRGLSKRAVLAGLRGASVCFRLILVISIVYLPIYIKLGLTICMTTQMSDGKEVDILNC